MDVATFFPTEIDDILNADETTLKDVTARIAVGLREESRDRISKFYWELCELVPGGKQRRVVQLLADEELWRSADS